MSTDEVVIEAKDANLTHSIKGSDIDAVFRRAARQGKQAEYVIYFAGVDITLTGRLTRGKG